MRRLSLLAAALAVLLARLAQAAEPDDPRSLFDAGQYSAAAAGYERLWTTSHLPQHGLNAVIAWRTAGRYTHARSLLEQLMSNKLPPELQTRAALLRSKLEGLTATISLEGEPIPVDALVKIDNAPAVRIGKEFVAPVGRRELTVERKGCDLFRWQGILKPGQRLNLPFRLSCKVMSGSLHVTLDGAPWAMLRVDGKPVAPQDPYDTDLSLSPGEHALQATRRGILLESRRFRIDAGRKTSVPVDVPWRGKAFGILGGASADAFSGLRGSTATAGLMLGCLVDISGSVAHEVASSSLSMLLTVQLGVANSNIGLPGNRFWMGLTAGFLHVLPPAWQSRTGKTTWVLDFEPGLFSFGGGGKGRGDPDVVDNDTIFHWNFVPVVLTSELPFVHLELMAWPVGFVSHSPHSFWGRTEYGYTGGISLRAGWAALGR